MSAVSSDTQAKLLAVESLKTKQVTNFQNTVEGYPQGKHIHSKREKQASIMEYTMESKTETQQERH